MHLDMAILAGSLSFSDFLVPGLILGGLFGVGSLVIAAIGLRRNPLAPFLAFAIGCGQMIWIVDPACDHQGGQLSCTRSCSGSGLVIAGVSRAVGLADIPGLADRRLSATDAPAPRSQAMKFIASLIGLFSLTMALAAAAALVVKRQLVAGGGRAWRRGPPGLDLRPDGVPQHRDCVPWRLD